MHSPTKASDIFSFGLVLYELLAGRPAFSESNLLRVLKRIRSADPDDLAADVGEPFRPLLCRMLARRPTMRTITMGEVEQTLAKRKQEP